ncbi:MAG: hypothetical protein WAX80_01060 [Minisyncoccia bacterium]
MAEGKPPSKPAEFQTDSKTVGQIVTILVIFIILGMIMTALLNFINSFGSPDSLGSRWVDYFLNHIWPIWKLIAAIVSVLAIVGIVHTFRKLGAINLEEQKIYGVPLAIPDSEEEIVEPKNDKWEQVLKYMNSNSSSDWRLAVIEADVILEELLRSLGYEGESVGEMLKSVDKSDFLTIEHAWEAHKVRNAVAHSGGDFQLNERETRRVIGLFEKVFREFDVI